MLKVTKNAAEPSGISQIATAGPVVRNDEATGSIPVSSTNVTYDCCVALEMPVRLRRAATISEKSVRQPRSRKKGEYNQNFLANSQHPMVNIPKPNPFPGRIPRAKCDE
jgi:hypothetical protein